MPAHINWQSFQQAVEAMIATSPGSTTLSSTYTHSKGEITFSATNRVQTHTFVSSLSDDLRRYERLNLQVSLFACGVTD
ncbi:hypothetical protein H696_01828 [Fonticula alba]|uniref:SRP9 domain-containing protein n=1 Tax=Fonticula alba TaxID=691883 RepID=A0A058Z9C8_FONAL|nr:hypothetical protein H696_01828 [Fonticula alba]KCV70880.1 hypothetical protein H696_01828 [Fonticula alba]|eukprot:XP_009494003.1 hypothetical protein H696_01828 [Fonticula alba]